MSVFIIIIIIKIIITSRFRGCKTPLNSTSYHSYSQSSPSHLPVVYTSVIIIIIIIIAFKGAIWYFLQSPHSAKLSPTRTLKWPGHVQHIERLSRASVMLRATWYEGTAQLLILTELKSHLFELYFIGWTIKPMKLSYTCTVHTDHVQCKHNIKLLIMAWFKTETVSMYQQWPCPVQATDSSKLIISRTIRVLIYLCNHVQYRQSQFTL